MNQTEFAKAVGIKGSMWSMVLDAKRNLRFKKAEAVAEMLKTTTNLWMDPTATKEDRRAAWERYKVLQTLSKLKSRGL